MSALARPARPLRVSTTRRLDDSCLDRCRGDQMHFRTLITPGVLDERTRHAYFKGQCHALAIAINELTGWTAAALHNCAEPPAWATPWHVMSRLPDRRLLDIRGVHTEAQILEEFQGLWLVDLATPKLTGLHLREGRGPLAECMHAPNMTAARPTARALLEHLNLLAPSEGVADVEHPAARKE